MAIRQIGISAVEAAVYTRLTTSAYMTGYTTKVYNFVPDGTAMPYIRFGDAIDGRDSMFSSRDNAPEEIAFNVHVWSNYAGDKEAGDIMTVVCQALESSDLSVTGYSTLWNARLDYSEIMIDDTEPARPVRHGVMRFIIRVCPT
jgi:hypothetical protein